MHGSQGVFRFIVLQYLHGSQCFPAAGWPKLSPSAQVACVRSALRIAGMPYLHGVIPWREYGGSPDDHRRQSEQRSSDDGFWDVRGWTFAAKDACAPTLVFFDDGHKTNVRLRIWVGPADVLRVHLWMKFRQARPIIMFVLFVMHGYIVFGWFVRSSAYALDVLVYMHVYYIRSPTSSPAWAKTTGRSAGTPAAGPTVTWRGTRLLRLGLVTSCGL